MLEIVCEDCHREQQIAAYEVEPSCERCGSSNLTQVEPAGVA